MRREKSLRIGVHHANAVVWEPVYRTHLRVPAPHEEEVPAAKSRQRQRADDDASRRGRRHRTGRDGRRVVPRASANTPRNTPFSSISAAAAAAQRSVRAPPRPRAKRRRRAVRLGVEGPYERTSGWS